MCLKTKETIVDYRRQEQRHGEAFIHDQEVDIVNKHKSLGTIFDGKVNWDDNTEAVLGKGQERVYLLRKLKSFPVDEKILFFHKSVIESVLSFSVICWYNSLSVKNKNSSQKIVRI